MNKEFEFTDCQTCGASNGIYRWYNKRYECNKCASKSFLKFFATISGLFVIGYIALSLFQ